MIVLKDVCKSFGSKEVLHNLSFHIAQGESVGLIGLNGAGKTTMLNIIAGLLKQDSGFIRVNGTECLINDHEKLKEVSYVSGVKSQLWEDLTIRGSLENAIKMYGISKTVFDERFKELNDVFQIEHLLGSNPKNLSLGEKMRCELVYALISAPKILMMDEAMIGLDVSNKHRIVEYFEKNKNKFTLIYTSHNLLEVEKICDRIILIDSGRIIYDGEIMKIMKEFSPLYRLEINISGSLPDMEDMPINRCEHTNDTLIIEYDQQKIDTTQIIKHIKSKTQIDTIKYHEPNLEDTIKKVYGRKK